MFDFDVAWLAMRLIAGAFVGFSIGLTGVGGGVMMIPILTLLFKLPPSTAVGTASLYIFITDVSATIHHYKLKTVDTMTAVWILAGAIPTNILVASAINAAVHRLADQADAIVRFQGRLKLFIACVIIFSCVMLILNMVRRPKTGDNSGRSSVSKAIWDSKTRYRVAAALMGTIVGALIGSTSVGGGVIVVPMLMICFGLTSNRTVGTSILIAAVLTLVTSTVFLIGGQVTVVTAVCMAVGSMIGVPLGSKLSVKLPEKVLKSVIVTVIIVSAVLMLRGNSGH